MTAIARFKPTILFTAPTSYRFMLSRMEGADLSSLRLCVSAGETLPKSTSDAWFAATGIRLIDGIGGTEMLHIFISASGDDIRPGATGKRGAGLRGAGGGAGSGSRCRRARWGGSRCAAPPVAGISTMTARPKFAVGGWNLTGDTYTMDEDGYFWYGARSDDMIVSSGYNIAGPEVEEALLQHAAVLECGVVGAPDDERGQVVKAYVVLASGHTASEAMTQSLQAHVRAVVAPYKYPRQIEYVPVLPRTETGKIQRFKLREMAQL